MYLCFYIIHQLARLHWVQPVLSQAVEHPKWLLTLLLVTALAGIPIRLYLLSAVDFWISRLARKIPALISLCDSSR